MRPAQQFSPALAYDALAWQADMGVDLCVEELPQTIHGEPKPPRPSVSTNSESFEARESIVPTAFEMRKAAPAPSSSAVAEAVAEARALANAAGTLADLELAVRSFNGCALKKTATNTVFAQGIATSSVMFIGEAPGADEDRQGVPFCGASGQLLDLMLGYIGLKRSENFYITNTLFWRPPGNRQPTEQELEICRPFVEKHIALINPKILVLVGGTATKSVLNETRGITRLRGQVFEYKNIYIEQPIKVHVIYHPSYLLRQPLAKKLCWADLLALKDALKP